MEPVISFAVATPAYNDAAFLTDCVESVGLAAFRAGVPVEHAVMDDASTDDTHEVLSRLAARWRLVSARFRANQGTSAALNAAVNFTGAPWVLVLASDDTVMVHAFADALEAIHANPDANVIYSDARMFGTEGGTYSPPPFTSETLRQRSIIPGCAFFRRELFDAVGGFDESMRTAQDWDFWVRADTVVGLRPVRLPRPFWRYRRHATPRLHNESVRNIDAIRRTVRGRTPANSVLTRHAVGAA